MDDNGFVSASASNCFKEAVCIDAMRVYDSCSDKDCLEDLTCLLYTGQKRFDCKCNERAPSRA